MLRVLVKVVRACGLGMGKGSQGQAHTNEVAAVHVQRHGSSG